MSKVQSGLVLIGVGVAMNLLGRLFLTVVRSLSNLLLTGLMAFWMFASVVVALFGLFRLVVGLVSRNRSS